MKEISTSCVAPSAKAFMFTWPVRTPVTLFRNCPARNQSFSVLPYTSSSVVVVMPEIWNSISLDPLPSSV